jgi:hypothetical protein
MGSFTPWLPGTFGRQDHTVRRALRTASFCPHRPSTRVRASPLRHPSARQGVWVAGGKAVTPRPACLPLSMEGKWSLSHPQGSWEPFFHLSSNPHPLPGPQGHCLSTAQLSSPHPQLCLKVAVLVWDLSPM